MVTTPQFVFLCVLVLAGGWFGGLADYALLKQKRQPQHRTGARRGKT